VRVATALGDLVRTAIVHAHLPAARSRFAPLVAADLAWARTHLLDGGQLVDSVRRDLSARADALAVGRYTAAIADNVLTRLRIELLGLESVSGRTLNVRTAAWVASLGLAGCGPSVGNAVGDSSTAQAETTTLSASDSDETVSSTSVDSGESTHSTASTSSAASSGADASSSEESGTSWPEPELLATLDGDPAQLEVAYITVAGDHLHVGTLVVGNQSRHWVLQRGSGEEVAVSPAGGSVVATSTHVYSAGYRTGDSADVELALVRMNHDGTEATELLVTTDVPFAFAASASSAFIGRWPDFDHFEIWVAADEMPNPELLLDTGQQSMGSAIYREGALLVPDGESESVLRLDLDTLLFEPLFSPPEAANVLASTNDLVLAGTSNALYRADEVRLEVEPVDIGYVWAVAADDEEIFWLEAGDQVRLMSTSTQGGAVEEVPLGDDFPTVRNLAIAPDCVYILAAGSLEASGSVWRVQRRR
jgi:hypothetical protein